MFSGETGITIPEQPKERTTAPLDSSTSGTAGDSFVQMPTGKKRYLKTSLFKELPPQDINLTITCQKIIKKN